MDNEKLTLICLVLILSVAVVCIGIASNYSIQEKTQISILNSLTLHEGETVIIQLTTQNGTPISNQQVDVTLVNNEGGRNTLNLITDSEGQASFELDGVAVGSYILECVFNGNDNYEPSNNTATLDVEQQEPQLIAERTVCGGDKLYFYSDGTYKSYTKEGKFYKSGYGTPDTTIG